MAILKFRIYLEEDEAVHRDVLILHTQTFLELHQAILKSFEFDNKHQATFYRSNDNWQRGREISLQQYDKNYKVVPLLMDQTAIGSEIHDTNQRFIYIYDFVKNWTFLIELINVSKENSKSDYPQIIRVEGIGPQQYGTRSLLGEKYADIEEKYDLASKAEGFSEEIAADDDAEPGELTNTEESDDL